MTIYQVNHITADGEEVPLRRFDNPEDAQRFINSHNNHWGYYMLTLSVREEEDYEGTRIY